MGKWLLFIQLFNIVILELVLIISPFILLKAQWISIYTDDEYVITRVKEITPICAFVIFLGAIEITLGSAIRGIGKQKLGAISYVLS